MNSNLAQWKRLQEEGYFKNHPLYAKKMDFQPDEAVYYIEQFVPLSPEFNVVVIGCGYGRESANLAKRVRHVWGIDVTDELLREAVKNLGERGINNFTPVLADSYGSTIPSGIHVVFSIVVMQHLTRDLVKDYFTTLGQKLATGGHIIVQFIESLIDNRTDVDLSMVHEPSVSWTIKDLHALSKTAGLQFTEISTMEAHPTCLWHWVHFTGK